MSHNEIRERMAGNICRCGAYANIVDGDRFVPAGYAVKNFDFDHAATVDGAS